MKCIWRGNCNNYFHTRRFQLMSILIAIIVSITYPILLYFCWTDNPQTSRYLNIRLIRIVYIVNTTFLLFCCIYYLIAKLQLEIHSQGLLYAVVFPLSFVLLLRTFFLPYVHSVLWTIVYIKYLKKKRFPKKETILFIILFVLSIIGLICMELLFQGLMIQ